jgi:hypothetical protein
MWIIIVQHVLKYENVEWLLFLTHDNKKMARRNLTATQCSTIRRAAAKGGYFTNPITGKRVYATSTTGKSLVKTCSVLIRKPSSRKPKKMTFRKNQPRIKKFKGDRPSPGESATLFPAGTQKRGNDGNMWVVRVSKSGIHRWVRV